MTVQTGDIVNYQVQGGEGENVMAQGAGPKFVFPAIVLRGGGDADLLVFSYGSGSTVLMAIKEGTEPGTFAIRNQKPAEATGEK